MTTAVTACLVVFAECVLHASQQDQSMAEIEGREVMYGQLLGVMLFPMQLLVLQLAAILEDAAKNGQVLCLTRKHLDMLMCLGGSCLGAAIEEVKAFDCSEGENGMFEVISGQGIGLGFKLASDYQHVLLVEVELIEQKTMRRPQFFHKQTLYYSRGTSSKGGRKGLRTSSFISLSFWPNFETSKNCIVMSLASVECDCSSKSDSLDTWAFQTMRSMQSLISWILSTAGPLNLLQKRKLMKAPSMNMPTPAPFSTYSCVRESHAHDSRYLHHANDDIIKINQTSRILYQNSTSTYLVHPCLMRVMMDDCNNITD